MILAFKDNEISIEPKNIKIFNHELGFKFNNTITLRDLKHTYVDLFEIKRTST